MNDVFLMIFSYQVFGLNEFATNHVQSEKQ